jgi:hypothetical protein
MICNPEALAALKRARQNSPRQSGERSHEPRTKGHPKGVQSWLPKQWLQDIKGRTPGQLDHSLYTSIDSALRHRGVSADHNKIIEVRATQR